MKKQTLSHPIMVILLATFCSALWGSAFPSIKLGYSLLSISSNDSASQILFAGYRFTLAGLMVIALGSLTEKKILFPKKADLLPIVVLSIFQTIAQYVCFYLGLSHASGVNASIISSTSHFLALLLSSLLFHQELLTGRKTGGCLLGFGGVVLLNLSQGGLGGFMLQGEGLLLLSTVSSAFSVVFIRRFSQQHDPVMVSGYQFFLGGLVMIAFGNGMGGAISGFSTVSVLLLFYLGFISAAAYTLWSLLLKYNPVSKVTAFGFMTPVFGVFLSFFLLHESGSLGIVPLLSLFLVSLGIYLVNKPARNKASKAQLPESN